MKKRNFINFEVTFTKFYDKMNSVRNFDGSPIRSSFKLVALRNGDVSAVLTTGYGKRFNL